MATTKAVSTIVKRPAERTGRVKVANAMKAIRSFCLECVETTVDVAECCDTRCPLWPYRFGRGYTNSLSAGLIVDPNSKEAHELRDQWAKKPK